MRRYIGWLCAFVLVLLLWTPPLSQATSPPTGVITSALCTQNGSEALLRFSGTATASAGVNLSVVGTWVTYDSRPSLVGVSFGTEILSCSPPWQEAAPFGGDTRYCEAVSSGITTTTFDGIQRLGHGPSTFQLYLHFTESGGGGMQIPMETVSCP